MKISKLLTYFGDKSPEQSSEGIDLLNSDILRNQMFVNTTLYQTLEILDY